jgi:hypothetical protein
MRKYINSCLAALLLCFGVTGCNSTTDSTVSSETIDSAVAFETTENIVTIETVESTAVTAEISEETTFETIEQVTSVITDAFESVESYKSGVTEFSSETHDWNQLLEDDAFIRACLSDVVHSDSMFFAEPTQFAFWDFDNDAEDELITTWKEGVINYTNVYDFDDLCAVNLSVYCIENLVGWYEIDEVSTLVRINPFGSEQNFQIETYPEGVRLASVAYTPDCVYLYNDADAIEQCMTILEGYTPVNTISDNCTYLFSE